MSPSLAGPQGVLPPDMVARDGGPDFRNPFFAECPLEVDARADGSWIIANRRPVNQRFANCLDPLIFWAREAKDRVWLAEREWLGPNDPRRKDGQQIGDWQTLSFAQALRQVRQLAGTLRDLGLGNNDSADRVLIVARNGIAHALLTYAIQAIGGIAAPVSPQYAAPGAHLERLRAACALIKPRLIFVDDAALYGANVDAVRAQFAADHPHYGMIPVLALRNPRPGDLVFADCLTRSVRDIDLTDHSPLMPEFVRVDGQDIAKILLTSGSTGVPKGVLQTHHNLAINAAQIEACFEIQVSPHMVVNSAPWSHSLGANAVLHTQLSRGGTIYIDHGQPAGRRFLETLANLRDIAPTHHNMVPAGWALLASALEEDRALADHFFSRLRLMQYGGASLAQNICDRVQAAALRHCGARISFGSGYGATETGPTACNVHWITERAGQIGLPVPGTILKLAPLGDKLEARIRGPQIFAGYLDRPDLTKAAFDEEGYYRLGDAVRFVMPGEPKAGLSFDGRLVEDFKLASGTFVSAGALRVAILSALGGIAADAIICGEGQDAIGVLLFLSPAFCQNLAPEIEDPRGFAAHEMVLAPLREAMDRYHADNQNPSRRIGILGLLPEAPDPASGEITDKGYLNQALCRARRAPLIEQIFAWQSQARSLDAAPRITTIDTLSGPMGVMAF